MRLGIIEYFDSSHFLPEHHSCGIMHGHTYKVEVILTGEKKGRGMIIDFQDVKKAVKKVLSRYDHKVLNDMLEYPSAENICQSIHNELKEDLDFPLIVRLWEGRDKWVEYSD